MFLKIIIGSLIWFQEYSLIKGHWSLWERETIERPPLEEEYAFHLAAAAQAFEAQQEPGLGVAVSMKGCEKTHAVGVVVGFVCL